MRKFYILMSTVFFGLMCDNAMASGYTFFSQLEYLMGLKNSQHVITFLFVAICLLGLGMAYRYRMSSVSNAVIPDQTVTLRNLCEAYGQFIYNQCKAIIGENEGPKYFSFVAFLFIFILMNNLLGLVPGFLPATENLNTTLALGILSFVYYNIKGCQIQGTWNYIKHFMGPLWYMAILVFPIEIISNAVRPLSLALRLRGNMFGDHLVMGIFSDLVPLLVPIVFMILGILVSFIQAYVFTILSMVYVSLATAHHDHGEEHAHH